MTVCCPEVVTADVIAEVVGLVATLLDFWLYVPAVFVRDGFPPVACVLNDGMAVIPNVT